jgi:hypothetical protein
MGREPPERYWSCDAINQLADRFNLPIEESDQDWPFQIADHQRVEEFLAVFKEPQTCPDQRFVLMDILLQCFEDLAGTGLNLKADNRWIFLLNYLEQSFKPHAWQVWYWSDFRSSLEDAWCIAVFMRILWEKRNNDSVS